MRYSLGALLLAAACTVHSAPLSPSRLVLISRTHVEGRTPTSPPSCATFHGTVGAQALHDVYHVSGECEREVRRRGGVAEGGQDDAGPDTLRVMLERGSTLGAQGLDGTRDVAGMLYWLHLTTVEATFALSADTTGASSAQITFSSHEPSLETSPDLEPTRLLDLPSGEGRLVLLSPDPATATAQLSYMSSHPAYSHYSLVALPRLSASLDGSLPFPEVPAASVNRIKAHLEGLTFQPLLSKVISALNSGRELERMRRDVRTLSGEDQSRLEPSERVSLPRAILEDRESPRACDADGCGPWTWTHSGFRGIR